MQSSEAYFPAADGVRLHYQVLGSRSRPILIPNGFYFADDFQHLFPDRALIVYDPRNRARSESITDPVRLEKGIHNDVEDLETARRHFGIETLDLIGHSYIGMMVILYAMKYPDRVNRIVQIGPVQPDMRTQYPAHLKCMDATSTEVMSKIAELARNSAGDPVERCREFWKELRKLYVAHQSDADRITWDRCDLPNELNFMRYWTSVIFPSIQVLALGAEDFARVKSPVLTIHGVKDRSAPYGGGREWAMRLPNARLITIENAAHAPWIEAPERVFGAIQTFFNNRGWPNSAEAVTSVDPAGKVSQRER